VSSPPLERRGDRLVKPTAPKTVSLVDHTALVCSSQHGWPHNCQHDTKVLVKLAPDSPHYAQEICEVCGAFVRWIPRPENLETQRLRAERIAKLSKCDGLTDWERGFVASVSKFRKLSPKQAAVIDRLFARYRKEVCDDAPL